jgi:SAM-dependent methyltransferase
MTQLDQVDKTRDLHAPALPIDYTHAATLHTLQGAKAALATIFNSTTSPKSLLDVGCGTGTWLRAAADLGVDTIVGIDGISAPDEQLHVKKEVIELHDLSIPFSLGRRFELAICLEVGEHLPERSSASLISSIVSHADAVYFSAACPGQPGQHHVNCQWPAYWQTLFNRHGYSCDDAIRWLIWEDTRIEPWYRQNIFAARRDPLNAGREGRLKSVIHPGFDGIVRSFDEGIKRINVSLLENIEHGRMRASWYLTISSLALVAKLRRRLRRTRET